MTKKATDKCVRCKERFKLTQNNTVAYIFTNPGCEDYNYMTSVCSKCENKNWTFMYGYLPELVQIIKWTECEVVAKPYPSEELLLDWCKVYKIKRLVERDLTSHEEHEVEFFAWLLGVDPKYIWQEFE